MSGFIIFSNFLYCVAVVVFLYTAFIVFGNDRICGLLLGFGVFLMGGPILVFNFWAFLNDGYFSSPWWMEVFSFVSPAGYVMVAVSFLLVAKKIFR